LSVGEAAAISPEQLNVLEVYALFFPIANGDDALAFAIPLEVVAVFLIQKVYSFMSCARRKSKKENEEIARTSSLR
jgi:hypothetical protein